MGVDANPKITNSPICAAITRAVVFCCCLELLYPCEYSSLSTTYTTLQLLYAVTKVDLSVEHVGYWPKHSLFVHPLNDLIYRASSDMLCVRMCWPVCVSGHSIPPSLPVDSSPYVSYWFVALQVEHAVQRLYPTVVGLRLA